MLSSKAQRNPPRLSVPLKQGTIKAVEPQSIPILFYYLYCENTLNNIFSVTNSNCKLRCSVTKH